MRRLFSLSDNFYTAIMIRRIDDDIWLPFNISHEPRSHILTRVRQAFFKYHCAWRLLCVNFD